MTCIFRIFIIVVIKLIYSVHKQKASCTKVRNRRV